MRHMWYKELRPGDMLIDRPTPSSDDGARDEIELVISVEIGNIKMDGLEGYHLHTLLNGKPKMRMKRKTQTISKRLYVFREGIQIWPRTNTHD
ncbi:hypothetical protein HN588_03435 [Candidatus Bathyarchaeota archaeon]|jgi:hypothetical protein|nr:hypothetical protein [Candidatus Bathyarchaeota archaeon]